MSELGPALMVVGATLAVAEAHVSSHGALGVASVVALAAGLALVVSGAGVGLVAVVVGLAVAAVGGVYLVVVLTGAGRAPVARPQRARGAGRARGEVRTAPAPLGRVFVDGALWRARTWGSKSRGAAVRRPDRRRARRRPDADRAARRGMGGVAVTAVLSRSSW